MEKKVMTLEEVAEYFGKHPQTAKRWLKKGSFPPHFIHERTVYVKVTDFQEWLDKKMQASEPIKGGDAGT